MFFFACVSTEEDHLDAEDTATDDADASVDVVVVVVVVDPGMISLCSHSKTR
jgi:hypothetical protein